MSHFPSARDFSSPLPRSANPRQAPANGPLTNIAYDIKYDIVIVADTNVVLRGCRSRNGASFVVLRGMLSGQIPFAASPTVILEYEEVLKRPGLLGAPPALTLPQVETLLDALCARAFPSSPWIRFRPFLDDPKDDHVIECALAAGARTIVTDDRGFGHPTVAAFGLRAIRPGDFVSELKQERKPK